METSPDHRLKEQTHIFDKICCTHPSSSSFKKLQQDQNILPIISRSIPTRSFIERKQVLSSFSWPIMSKHLEYSSVVEFRPCGWNFYKCKSSILLVIARNLDVSSNGLPHLLRPFHYPLCPDVLEPISTALDGSWYSTVKFYLPIHF